MYDLEKNRVNTFGLIILSILLLTCIVVYSFDPLSLNPNESIWEQVVLSFLVVFNFFVPKARKVFLFIFAVFAIFLLMKYFFYSTPA